MSNKINLENLNADFLRMGVKKGDIIFITIDILKVGYFNKSRNQTLQDWIDLLINLVGEEGAIIFASYSNISFILSKKTNTFHRYSETSTGSLPSYLINHPKSIRSNHPSHSLIAIGNVVRCIFEKHDYTKRPYSIMKDIINMPNSKFMMIGTIDKKNAPQAMHLVQEELGYTYKNMFKYLYKIKFSLGNSQKNYIVKEFGGCSRGGFKLFSYLLVENIITIDKIGKAESVIMDAQKSYFVINNVLKNNKNYIHCDNKYCIDCHGNLYNNSIIKIIKFYMLYTMKLFKKTSI